LFQGYSTRSVIVIEVVVGIDIELIIVVATQPRRTGSPFTFSSTTTPPFTVLLSVVAELHNPCEL